MSKKYGRVYPLAYEIVTCPQCLYSSFPKDFEKVEAAEVEDLKNATQDRKNGAHSIVGPIDFNGDRNLVSGAISYILAIDCYQKRDMGCAPTPKKAICSMRGAWLFSELDEEFPGMGYDNIVEFLYMKAGTYYKSTLEIMSNAHEREEDRGPRSVQATPGQAVRYGPRQLLEAEHHHRPGQRPVRGDFGRAGRANGR